MTAVGVICEYNPFHLGHQRQLQWIRQQFGEDTAVVCVMSGNFVQRGEPAVFDKFTRARAAVLCGADLVLELPLTGAIASAEQFACFGVEVLSRLGVVDALCFGSEHGDPAALRRTAHVLLSPEFGEVLRDHLAKGVSFAAARSAAAAQLGGDPALLRQPNDILAVEYCKALEQLQSSMEPVALERTGDYHALRPHPAHPSATALRVLLERGGDWKPYVPPAAAAVFAHAVPHGLQYGERAVLARLRGMTDEDFAALPYGGEGLWNRMRKACRREASVEAVLRAVKSKRYAHSRLRRMLLCAYLGISSADLALPISYVRVLAFGERGRPLLRTARDNGTLPLVHAGETPQDRYYYRLECRAADLYGLFAAETAEAGGLEALGRVFYKEESKKTLAK